MKRIILLILLLPLLSYGKVLIYTHSYNRPEFIELQVKTFKAFLQDEYEFVVFNDASNDGMRQAIETTCAKVGVRCIRVPQYLHIRQEPGWRHMDCIRYSFDRIGFDHDGIVLMIDSDMFLIKNLCIKDYMKDYDLIGNKQGRSNDSLQVIYMSPLLVFVNMNTIPNKRALNFDGGYVEGLACDVGGQTYYYFKNNPEAKVYYYFQNNIAFTGVSSQDSVNYLLANGLDLNTIDFIKSGIPVPYDFEMHGDGAFIHYRAGSNWIGYSSAKIQAKDKILYDFIDSQIAYYKKNIKTDL